jgi:hypothetical protein
MFNKRKGQIFYVVIVNSIDMYRFVNFSTHRVLSKCFGVAFRFDAVSTKFNGVVLPTTISVTRKMISEWPRSGTSNIGELLPRGAIVRGSFDIKPPCYQ